VATRRIFGVLAWDSSYNNVKLALLLHDQYLLSISSQPGARGMVEQAGKNRVGHSFT